MQRHTPSGEKLTERGRSGGRYPAGSVRSLLATDLVTGQTRRALQGRLEREDTASPRYFDARSFATLQAVCALLIPQPERPNPIDLAGLIDDRLADRMGDGWRYDALPPDGEAYILGLRGTDQTARALFGDDFAELDSSSRQAVLLAVQGGRPPGTIWQTLPAQRLFEELLAEVAEAYYSHPLAQEEIGYVGMADVPGWQAIGLDQLEAREPLPADDAVG